MNTLVTMLVFVAPVVFVGLPLGLLLIVVATILDRYWPSKGPKSRMGPYR